MHNIVIFLLLASAPPLPVAAQPGAGTPAISTTAAAPQAHVSTAAAKITVSTAAIRGLVLADRQVRGIHLSCWGAGGAKSRSEIIKKISHSVINTVVVAVKETDGQVYMPGVEKAHKWGSYTAAIPQPEAMMKDFKAAGLYTVARIVCFKDKIVPVKRPDLAVKSAGGGLWRSRNGATWLDPYNREVWDYLLDLAELSAKLGFDEIQFDYIRYPSEGNTALCRYSKPNNRQTSIANLGEFLRYARKRLAPYKVKISADVFGLTTSVKDDMGIGQDIKTLAENADYVYPMMYPSHYAHGEYNIKNPAEQPYKILNHGLKDARQKLGLDYAKIRPYLQDFWKYGPADVHAQQIATRINLLESWVLWNPSNNYTWAALTPQSYRATVDPEYK